MTCNKAEYVCFTNAEKPFIGTESLFVKVGRGLQHYFNGQAANLVLAAHKSAVSLVTMLTTYFPGFQDHCVYRCSPSVEH